MPEYEVRVRGYMTTTVTADSKKEAAAKAEAKYPVTWGFEPDDGTKFDAKVQELE